MDNSIIAWKTRAQLDDFMVKMFHGFSKPQSKFIRDMVYGIQATGDTILADIARAVDSEGRHRNVENRLSRNLQSEGLDRKLQQAVVGDTARRFVDRDTLVIVDPTDVCKLHARKMEHLTLVRDTSRPSKDEAVTTRGYHGCMVVACRSGSRKTVPLALKLWSSNAEGHGAATDPTRRSLHLPKSTSPLFCRGKLVVSVQKIVKLQPLRRPLPLAKAIEIWLM